MLEALRGSFIDVLYSRALGQWLSAHAFGLKSITPELRHNVEIAYYEAGLARCSRSLGAFRDDADLLKRVSIDAELGTSRREGILLQDERDDVDVALR